MTAPLTRLEVERRLQHMWTDLLGVEVDRDVGFFEVGGDSLLLGVLHDRVGREFGVELPAVALFDLPTIALLAAEIYDRSAGTPGAT
jgi:pristinamycin I synthase-3/4